MVKLVSRLASSAFIVISIFSFAPSSVFAQTPPPPTCTLSANPNSITIGGSVTLKWTSQNATAGTISHIGSVGPSGSVSLLPSAASQTTFTGTFTSPSGTATCFATITVSAAATSGSGGTYDPNANGAYSTGTTYDAGSTYTAGSTYQATTYGLNPSSFTTQPANSTFTNTPRTVTTGSPSTNNGISGFIVPCGSSANQNPSGLSYVDNATSCNICNLGTLSQNIINFLLMLSIPLAAGLFAWAGILRFTSAGNASKVTQSTKIFTSVFIGFAIALSGYLIVQTLLNALLNPSFQSGGISVTSLNCSPAGVDRPRHTGIETLFQGLFSPTGTVTGVGTPAVGGVNGGGRGVAQCTSDNTACSVSALQALNLTPTQANVMSCIAVTESSGNPNIGCSATATPCGLFQINNGNWNAYAPADCTSYTMKANASCNARTMAAMVNTPGVGYQPWTGSNASGVQWNPAASQCQANYDPNTTLTH